MAVGLSLNAEIHAAPKLTLGALAGIPYNLRLRADTGSFTGLPHKRTPPEAGCGVLFCLFWVGI